MAVEITLGTVMIFIGFVITVFVLYKLLKFIVRASIIIVASFAFPWVARYMGLAITANFETSILFAISGLVLFFVYECFHFIVQLFKILTWPFRRKR
jgi:hypothetical protein